MESQTRMTIVDLICYIRQRLLEGKAKKNKQLIEDLHIVLNTIFEIAVIKEDKVLALLLDRLTDAVGDYYMDDEWKSEIPTEEEIKNNLSLFEIN